MDSNESPNEGLSESLSRADSNRSPSDVADEGLAGKRSGRFKDQLRRSGSGGRGAQWTSTVHVPASDIPIGGSKSKMMARQPSTRMNSAGLDPDSLTHPDPAMRPSGRNTSIGRLHSEDSDNEEGEEEDGGGGAMAAAAEGDGEQPPVRMSLMSLLAETDAYVMDEDDEDEEEDDDGGGAAYNTCCVCMVRHKGTAFVPCGHSFCRLCSRELVVDRENCPLCNNYILEILDIF